LLLLCIILPSAVQGFVSQLRVETRNNALRMAPRFDPVEKRWYPRTDEEAQEAYGPVGSLIRQGPKPFISRLVNPDAYEQGVYKMMAQEGWDRLEAQGNMDAFLENAQDWVLQKQAEKKGAPKYDYANANTSPKQLVLTLTWAAIVVFVGGPIVYDTFITKTY